jgi:hypothetical protein
VKNIAFLDNIALLECGILQEPRHARADLHPFDSLDPPDEIGQLDDWPQLSRQNSDRDGGGLLCPNLRSRGDEAEQGDGMDKRTQRFTPSDFVAACWCTRYRHTTSLRGGLWSVTDSRSPNSDQRLSRLGLWLEPAAERRVSSR